jgi:hypothetical protein
MADSEGPGTDEGAIRVFLLDDHRWYDAECATR